MVGRSAILVTLFALASVYLPDYGRVLLTNYYNHPARLPQQSTFTSFETEYGDRIRNCEDIELDQDAGFALLSCDEGRDSWNPFMGVYIKPARQAKIYMYKYGDRWTSKASKLVEVELEGLSPSPRNYVGLAYHSASQTIYVANIGGPRTSIEVFHFDPYTPKAKLIQSFSHPLLRVPNSIAPISGNELYVTSSFSTSPPTKMENAGDKLVSWAIKAEGRLALPSGNVLYVNLKNGQAERLASVPFANGVEFLNSSTLAVSSTTKMAVYVYHIDSTKKLTYQRRITVPFLPDNIRIDANGKLLIAGHPYLPSFVKMAHSNFAAHQGRTIPEANQVRGRSSSWMAEWDPRGNGTVKTLYSGLDYSVSSTVVRDVKRKVVLAVGLYEHGIFVAKEE